LFGALTITFTSAAICAPEDSKSHESLEGGHLETFSDQSNIGQSLRYNAGVGIAFISQRKLQFEINYIRGEENVPNIELKKNNRCAGLSHRGKRLGEHARHRRSAGSEDCDTDIKPYAVSISNKYVVRPLLSVGDRVPQTSDPSKQYQMVGIPAGLGAHKGHGIQTVLYMNELSAQIRVRLSSPEVTMIDH